ncbi:hypothetical protein KFL_006530115 [Klebsormidium nitens]|uniref:Uncharacterized protein n=1 Tax=Klebsormidium nitens TaxID=105231 RepID=A0A1Y1II35_KLENI|nr:hypothetical protein KFL_006530115 [Klebsormidium nitens]|eukprot:GAQ90545.1 hypothetical protein KFL_006530115 [Klebsormidium nitens]
MFHRAPGQYSADFDWSGAHTDDYACLATLTPNGHTNHRGVEGSAGKPSSKESGHRSSQCGGVSKCRFSGIATAPCFSWHCIPPWFEEPDCAVPQVYYSGSRGM